MNEPLDRLRHVRPGEHAETQPRDAATLILIDRTTNPPKLLLGRRHHGHVFMPGKFVFPGGRTEDHDLVMPVASPLHPQAEAKLMAGTPPASAEKARALALAAIRETFEETGLVLGKQRDDAPFVPEGVWSEFAATGFYPDLSVLHLVARAITPPGRTRRFDARFFTIDASAIALRKENVIHAEAELTELTWKPISEALELDLPDITQVVLEELKARVRQGFQQELAVPFYHMVNGRFIRESL